MSAEANQRAKVTLYWADTPQRANSTVQAGQSRSRRILWLLEEVKVDYELKIFKRGKDFLAPPELKDVHPLGKSPVSLEYLTEYFGKWMVPKCYPDSKEGLIGAETEEWLRYRFLMHYAEGSFMTIMFIVLMTHNIRNAPVPFIIKPITTGIAGKVDSSFVSPNLKTHLDFLEDQLATSPGGGEFFCGKELTGADILMIFPLEAAMQRAPIEEKTSQVVCMGEAHARTRYKTAGEKAWRQVERSTSPSRT